MYIGDSSLTSVIDKKCIGEIGIPEIVLMEHAGMVASERIVKLKDITIDDSIMIVCGVGNNGGDGFVIARLLRQKGYEVSIVVIGDISKMSYSTSANYQISKNLDIEILYLDKESFENKRQSFQRRLKSASIVIDSIFGSGLNRNIEGLYKTVIQLINDSIYDLNKIVSIDIPSGFNATTGEVMGASIEADYTITFEYYKKGFLRYDATKYTGKVFVEKIGVPRIVYKNLDIKDRFVDREYIDKILKVKPDFINKGDNGKVVIFGGSRGLYGAAYMSTRAAVKTGSGLVTLVCDEDVQKVLSTRFTEEMSCLKSEKKRLEKILSNASCIAYGPGVGNTIESKMYEKKLLSEYSGNIVLDADGINMFEKSYMHSGLNMVITPHMGEFSRLIGVDIEEINRDRIEYAKKYALENNLVVVLKGKNTIITDGEKSIVNTTGNKSMANGGMGDVLTGMITSFIGQGYNIFDGSVLGVFFHGLCADYLAKEREVVNPTDILEYIPIAIKKFRG